MIQFRNQYDAPVRHISNSGSRIKITYTPQYNDKGVLELVETGKENLYEYIQSHKESVDIHVIMKRFQNGEIDVLSQVQGFYGDVTDVPQTFAEVLNAVIAGESMFSKLPLEVREKFNHSFSEFMVAMDKPDFYEKLGYQKKESESEPAPAAELKGDEN